MRLYKKREVYSLFKGVSFKLIWHICSDLNVADGKQNDLYQLAAEIWISGDAWDKRSSTSTPKIWQEVDASWVCQQCESGSSVTAKSNEKQNWTTARTHHPKTTQGLLNFSIATDFSSLVLKKMTKTHLIIIV